jgi:hypothetical protein
VTGLVKPFIKGFFSSLIFLIVVCLWAGNLNNLLGLAFMSAFCGGLWALISVGDAPHHSGKDLTTSAKKRNNSTPSSRSIKNAAFSNPVIPSDSNKNSSISNSVDCWKCRGKGYQSGTSMHGSVIKRDCENCSKTGKVTHAEFVKYKNKDRDREAELERKEAIKNKEEAQRQVTFARVNNNIKIYKVGVNFLGNSRKNRTTWCHGCKQDLSSSSHLECSLCGWLRCHCGTCKPSCGWRTKAMQEWM